MEWAKFLSARYITTMFLLAIPVFSENLARVSCPNFVTIEKGMESTLLCNTTDELVPMMYWYRGSPLTTSPILRLENGESGGLYYNTNHYDISKTGAMIIRNATINQEAVYTFVAFFKDGTYEGKNVTVNITVTPYPPCPLVSGCEFCGHCSLNVSDRLHGQVLCSVTDSRPQINIRWIIKSQEGLGLTVHQPTAIYDYNVGSWTSMANLSYDAHLCGEGAALQCLAEDNHGLMSHSFTDVRLFAADCVDDASVGGIAIGMGIIAAALVILLLVGVVIYYKMKVSESPLIAFLKTYYELECTLKLLPWQELIPVDSVFTDCQCEITYNGRQPINSSGIQLLNDDEIRNEELVLILGDRGCGKTTFAKQIVQQWCQGKEHTFTLVIFISLQGVNIDKKLTDIVKDTILKETGITAENIESALNDQQCLILLDGLQNIPLESFGQVNISKSSCFSDYGTAELTIKRLLLVKESERYKNIRVWITALDTSNSKYDSVHWSAKIHLKGFSEDHMKMYLRKVCTYYGDSNETEIHSVRKSSVDDKEVLSRKNYRTKTGNTTLVAIKGAVREAAPANENFETVSLLEKNTPSQAQITSNHAEEKNNDMITGKRFNLVYKFLCDNDIFKKFQSTPYLLFLMINIKSSALKNRIPQLQNVTINTFATLIHCVVPCLESTIGRLSQEKLDELNSFLGEIAFKTLFEGRPFKLESSSCLNNISEYVHTALAIGLVKESQVGDSGTSDGLWDFTLPSQQKMYFRNNSIRDYFAAYHISKNPDSFEILKEKIKTCIKGRSLWIGIFRLSCLFESTNFEELCEVLRACKFYDCIVDCLHDRANNDEVIRVIANVNRDHIVISHTNEDLHIEAVKTFLQACRTMQIKLKSVSFVGDWFPTYLEALEMPELENVELKATRISESEFISCLKWILSTKFTCNLRFTYCQIPIDLSAETRGHIKSLRGSNLQVHRKDVLGNKDVEIRPLNFTTGNWKLY